MEAAAPARGETVVTILLVLLGGFLVGVGWIVGVVMLWQSRAWTVGEKVVGTLILPGGLATGVVYALALTASFSGKCSGPHCDGGGPTALAVAAAVALVLAPIATAAFLARRARP